MQLSPELLFDSEPDGMRPFPFACNFWFFLELIMAFHLPYFLYSWTLLCPNNSKSCHIPTILLSEVTVRALFPATNDPAPRLLTSGVSLGSGVPIPCFLVVVFYQTRYIFQHLPQAEFAGDGLAKHLPEKGSTLLHLHLLCQVGLGMRSRWSSPTAS